jgi:Secretion system C-terminal sorting domain
MVGLSLKVSFTLMLFLACLANLSAQVSPLVVDTFFNDNFSCKSYGSHFYIINNKFSKIEQANFENTYKADSTAIELIALNSITKEKNETQLRSKKDTILLNLPYRPFLDFEGKTLLYCAHYLDSITNLAASTLDFYKHICIIKFDTLTKSYKEYRLINYDTGISLVYGNKLVHHDSICYTQVVNRQGKAWLAKYNLNTGMMLDTIGLFQIQLGYLMIQADFLNDSVISIFVNPIQQINLNTMQVFVKPVLTYTTPDAVILPSSLEFNSSDTSYVAGGADGYDYRVTRYGNNNIAKLLYRVPINQQKPVDKFVTSAESFTHTGRGNYFVAVRPLAEIDTFAVAYGTKTNGHKWLKLFSGPINSKIIWVSAEADSFGNCLVLIEVNDSINGGFDSYYLLIDSLGMPIYPLSIQLPQAKDKTIAIYPNPTQTYFNLDLSPNEKVSVIRLLDYHGKQVRSYSTSTNCKVEDLPRGVYFVEVIIDNQKFMSRLLLE